MLIEVVHHFNMCCAEMTCMSALIAFFFFLVPFAAPVVLCNGVIGGVLQVERLFHG